MIRNRSRRLGARSTACGYAIYRGITTGLNEAFIIDNETKEALVAEDPRSAEIIKPVLRGRDIQRYRAEWAGKWLIATHNGYGDVPPVEIDAYPAIKDFLDRHYERLAKRYDKGRTPYNLRNCAYHAEFQKEKLLWMGMTPEGRFSYSDKELFGIAQVYLLTGHSLKFLNGMLNSTLVNWFMNNTCITTGMGLIEWKIFAVSRIPVHPAPRPQNVCEITEVVDSILAVKGADPSADSTHMEHEIDRLVYDLYGLTEKEIAAVEESLI